MDNDEKALLRESLDGIVRDTRPDRLDEALADFGWPELLESEPGVAVSLLLELQGQLLAKSSALDLIMKRAAGVDDADDVTIVYPMPGSPRPTSGATVTSTGARVDILGMVTVRAQAPRSVLIPAELDGRPVLIRTGWHGEWPTSGTGIDPTAGWAKLVTTLEVDTFALVGETSVWRALRAAGHRALAHELLGLGTMMLELAVDHVSSRTQFGRALGSFQAVKHKLADVRLWQECAILAAAAAWEPTDEHEKAVAATIAKVTANRFSQAARQHCQQVLGGMGFTWEHDFHRYLKRTLLLEPLLGSTESLYAELGGHLRAGSLPRLAML